MYRLLSCLILVSLLFGASACSSKKLPDQTSYKTKTILTTLRDMNKYYEAKDLDAFLSDVSKSYPDRDGFAKALTTVFSKYETIRFNVQYAKMIVMIGEAGRMKAAFTWDAEWIAGGGTSVKDGGRVTLVFEPGDFKLIAIDGKNPFLAQPGETPGAKP